MDALDLEDTGSIGAKDETAVGSRESVREVEDGEALEERRHCLMMPQPGRREGPTA